MYQDNVVEELTYGELCKKFNEIPKQGRSRTDQFSKWRNEYSIEKIDNSYRYKVHPLSISEKNDKLKNGKKKYVSNCCYIESLIFDYLSQRKDYCWDATLYDRQKALGLVNDNYQITISDEQYNILFDDYNITKENAQDFHTAIYEMNRESINYVRDSMKKKGYIAYEKAFEVMYETGRCDIENKPIYLTGEQMKDVMVYRNKVTREITNGEFNTFEMIKNKGIKQQIRKIVNEHFGFKYHFDAERWWLDTSSIREANFADALPLKERLIKCNENHQLKTLHSKKKLFKNIDKISRQKLVKIWIDIETDKIDLY